MTPLHKSAPAPTAGSLGDDGMATFSLLNDQALGEGDASAQDGLGFDVYAKVLADAALGTPGPFTIGVFGEWGTGKTSLLRMIKRHLDEGAQKENIVTVWFNAWRYEQEQHPIVPLVGTILHELERKQTFLDSLKDNARKLTRALRAIAYGFSAKTSLKIPGFAEIEAGFVAKDMIERAKELTPDPLIDRSLYYEAFDALSAIELKKDARIIVFIDDLDRCFPNQAIKLLESIKLVLAQPGFFFVLGVARKVIEGYLQHRYTTRFGIPEFSGAQYLDKIVQLRSIYLSIRAECKTFPASFWIG
jgi:predicted KAP-like P-loop ATPase